MDERRKYDILMFLMTVGYIFIGGSRGPLVSIFVLFLYWIFTIKPKWKRNLSAAILSAIAIPSLLFWKELLMLLYGILNKMGVNSRSLYMMINGMGTYDSGRSLFHDTLFKALNESPVLGLGAFGGEKTVGLAHSLYIDILANFGYVFGIVFMLLILWGICNQIKSKNDTARSEVIIMMGIILFPRGFFDETFWGAWPLWLIMGLLLGKKKVVRNNQEGIL